MYIIVEENYKRSYELNIYYSLEMSNATMFTLASSILVCLAVGGQVVSSAHLKDDLSKVEIQTMETALIMRLLQNNMAHIQGIFLTRLQAPVVDVLYNYNNNYYSYCSYRYSLIVKVQL